MLSPERWGIRPQFHSSNYPYITTTQCPLPPTFIIFHFLYFSLTFLICLSKSFSTVNLIWISSVAADSRMPHPCFARVLLFPNCTVSWNCVIADTTVCAHAWAVAVFTSPPIPTVSWLGKYIALKCAMVLSHTSVKHTSFESTWFFLQCYFLNAEKGIKSGSFGVLWFLDKETKKCIVGGIKILKCICSDTTIITADVHKYAVLVSILITLTFSMT